MNALLDRKSPASSGRTPGSERRLILPEEHSLASEHSASGREEFDEVTRSKHPPADYARMVAMNRQALGKLTLFRI